MANYQGRLGDVYWIIYARTWPLATRFRETVPFYLLCFVDFVRKPDSMFSLGKHETFSMNSPRILSIIWRILVIPFEGDNNFTSFRMCVQRPRINAQGQTNKLNLQIHEYDITKYGGISLIHISAVGISPISRL